MNVSPVDPDIRPIPLVISRLSVQFFTNGGVNPKDIHELTQVEPFHVAAFVHDLQDELSPPSVKQHLAAIRMLFDWLVTGHVIEANPAHSVRGPRYTVKKGKTPVLTPEEAHALLESIPVTKKPPMIQRRPISLICLGCVTARLLVSWSTASPGSAPSFR